VWLRHLNKDPLDPYAGRCLASLLFAPGAHAEPAELMRRLLGPDALEAAAGGWVPRQRAAVWRHMLPFDVEGFAPDV
jgi:hypothetical protein